MDSKELQELKEYIDSQSNIVAGIVVFCCGVIMIAIGAIGYTINFTPSIISIIFGLIFMIAALTTVKKKK